MKMRVKFNVEDQRLPLEIKAIEILQTQSTLVLLQHWRNTNIVLVKGYYTNKKGKQFTDEPKPTGVAHTHTYTQIYLRAFSPLS